MLPLMIPLQRRLEIEQEAGRFSVFTRLEGCVAVAALSKVAPGVGRAEVEGQPLSRWEAVEFRGVTLIFLPMLEAVRQRDRRYRVTLRGFRTPGGAPYPPCRFRVYVPAKRRRDPAREEADARTLEAAREGMVLLVNRAEALPLAPRTTLNCLGTAQHIWRTSVAGAARINPRWRPDFFDAVEDHSRFRVNEALREHYRAVWRDAPPPEPLLEQAAANGGPALVFIGRHGGEMLDSRDIPGEYRLSGEELALLRAARERFEKVVVILNTGGPVEMTWLREIPVDAVVFTGFAGMLSAWALVELLDGRTNPSGHLPDTWPWRYGDNPVSRNYPVRGADDPFLHEDAIGVRVVYQEDVYLGYRYFDTFHVPVAFPFGHGLSYTVFEMYASRPVLRGETIEVAVKVINTGKVPGKAVAQVYAAPPAGGQERPARVLAGFEKTALLAPGEAQTLSVVLRLEDLATFDEAAGSWVLEAGDYDFQVGESLGALTSCGVLSMEGRVLRRVKRLSAPMEPFHRLTRAAPEMEGAGSAIVPLGSHIDRPAAGSSEAPMPRATPRSPGEPMSWPEVLRDPSKLSEFVSGLSLLDLCRLNVCAGARWFPWQDGMAGYTPRLGRYGLPSFCASDANSGLNLARPNIGFPTSSVVAASFNRELARQVGQEVAREAGEYGVHLVLAPGMNLHRSPLCGRHAEYFSEDPLLTGEMAGCHGRGLTEGGVLCCYKHMFCNNAELGRLGSHSIVSERALRELYFRAFEIAFRVQKPGSVMTSYNALNGLYPGENPALLRDLLREEWGFEGFAMSDWSSTRTVSAVSMINAGLSWITPGGPKWVWRVWRAARRGEIRRETLERNVTWLLRAFAGGKQKTERSN